MKRYLPILAAALLAALIYWLIVPGCPPAPSSTDSAANGTATVNADEPKASPSAPDVKHFTKAILRQRDAYGDTLEASGGVFELYFIRRKNSGLTYTARFSHDLSSFEESNVRLVIDPIINSEYEVVRVPFPAALLNNNKPARFGCVRLATGS